MGVLLECGTNCLLSFLCIIPYPAMSKADVTEWHPNVVDGPGDEVEAVRQSGFFRLLYGF